LSQRPSYHHAKKLDCTSALKYYLDSDCLRAISRYESDHRTTSHCRGGAESSCSGRPVARPVRSGQRQPCRSGW